WLDSAGSKQLGERVWERELKSLNEQARVVLRVNTLKTSRIQLQRLMLEENIETVISPDHPDALILVKRQTLGHSALFKQGFFEVQDASSQLIAPFLRLKPGMSVIDACAGAGGKSLHIAAALQNQGRIISMDVEDRKLKELQKRSLRNGVRIIDTRLANPENVSALNNSCDRLLLDVPCSGLGVLRRNPDAKWKLSADFLNEVKATQQTIISDYSSMLKKGGIMVYATCSLLPEENENQVQIFLEKRPEFELLEDRKVMPSEGFDGFYMAAIKRN
nr:class I SAM-dependent methyltransferase [Bacteroidota bacterium]